MYKIRIYLINKNVLVANKTMAIIWKTSGKQKGFFATFFQQKPSMIKSYLSEKTVFHI